MRNTRIFDLILQAVQGVLHNLVVVESQLGKLIYREPANIFVHASLRNLSRRDRSPIHHRNHALMIRPRHRNRRAVNARRPRLRGTQNITERIQLLKVPGLKAGRALERVPRRLLQGLLGLQGAAGKRPLALIGLAQTAHQRQPQARVLLPLLRAQGKDDS